MSMPSCINHTGEVCDKGFRSEKKGTADPSPLFEVLIPTRCPRTNSASEILSEPAN